MFIDAVRDLVSAYREACRSIDSALDCLGVALDEVEAVLNELEDQ